MAKVIAPNQQYNGVSASVRFVDGVGETTDPYLISWFMANGYTVVKPTVRRVRKKAEDSDGHIENTTADGSPGD